ncbi:MAG: hypothetical protein O2782_03990 [bacterium]|nr:hypothetical protein [bacterium]
MALLLLGGLDFWVRHERTAQRLADSRLQALVDPAQQIVPERVRVVRVGFPGAGEFRYELQNGTWRFPAYFNAYVYGDRMQAFLGSIVSATGTRATQDANAHDELGVADHQAVRVILEDGSTALVEVRLGPGIPGPDGEESYARRAGSELALHLHAHPAQLLGDARPPLLDPHLLPRDGSRRAPTQVRIVTGEKSYLLRRVLAPWPEDAPPIPTDERDRYRWVLQRDTRIDTCDNNSVYMWLSWLRSVRFAQLVDPGDQGYGLGSTGTVELTDEADTTDRLLIGRAGSSGDSYVGNQSANLVAVMPSLRARWLLPPPGVLLDPLPDPSPYESIP